MNARILLRASACAIAIAAAVDPAVSRATRGPLAVDVRSASGTLIGWDAPAQERAVRQRIVSALGDQIAVDGHENPASTVIVGEPIAAAAVPASGPIDVVRLKPARAGVRIVSVAEPGTVLTGWAATISGQVQGGEPGSETAVVLEREGIEVDRTVLRWKNAMERQPFHLNYVAPTAGVSPLTVRIFQGGQPGSDRRELRVLAESRRLRVIAFDPRPSWASAFVRRELEADPVFDVQTLVRASRGLEVRTGTPPEALSTAALESADLVLIGAPEDLTSGDVDALTAFVSSRGGAVVLLPDRRPGGRYLPMLGHVALDELLLETPVKLTDASAAPVLRGSELVVPRALEDGAISLATFPHASVPRAAVVEWPLGRGRILFSGVLDAWRFRAEDDGAFGRFWRSRLAGAAARSPRRLEVRLEPGVAAVGQEVSVIATLRPSELSSANGRVVAPAVSGEVIDATGVARTVRLWPTAKVGVYSGRVEAGRPGRYDVRVRSDGNATADVPLIVSATQDAGFADNRADVVAGSSGGVAVDADALEPLIEHLRGLPRAETHRTVYPMRSAWWALAFALLLGGEWAARRASGLK